MDFSFFTHSTRLKMRSIAGCLLVFSLLFPLSIKAESNQASSKTINLFLNVFLEEKEVVLDSLLEIRESWEPSYNSMALETILINRDAVSNAYLLSYMRQNTGVTHGYDIKAWYNWLWSQPADLHPDYATFKSQLYRLIDPRFQNYFDKNRLAIIRLDEIMWGGVKQDGIPPLRYPKMITAKKAIYLDDDNIVFALEINGDYRAYPKRILAWHEMFVDTVGDIPVVGVYCTLCGAMILYQTEFEGQKFELGTSGFLYRSNKLMYDKKTQSLWSAIWGKPVVGPLVGKNIKLRQMPVITTTWKVWRNRHQQTTVLSLETGYQRDYGEGVAYHDYFADDKLMFPVPELDNRLRNKDEILGIIFDAHPEPMAISAEFLQKNPVYQDKIGDIHFVAFTDQSGANRVYESAGIVFKSWDQINTAVDGNGAKWSVSEGKLTASDGKTLKRLPAHRAFWFGWYAAYPNTRLVK